MYTYSCSYLNLWPFKKNMDRADQETWEQSAKRLRDKINKIENGKNIVHVREIRFLRKFFEKVEKEYEQLDDWGREYDSWRNAYITHCDVLEDMVKTLKKKRELSSDDKLQKARHDLKYDMETLPSLERPYYDFRKLFLLEDAQKVINPSQSYLKTLNHFQYYHRKGEHPLAKLADGILMESKATDVEVDIVHNLKAPYFKVTSKNGTRNTIIGHVFDETEQRDWISVEKTVTFLPGEINWISFPKSFWKKETYSVYLNLNKDSDSGWYIPSEFINEDDGTRLELFLEKTGSEFKLDAYRYSQLVSKKPKVQNEPWRQSSDQLLRRIREIGKGKPISEEDGEDPVSFCWRLFRDLENRYRTMVSDWNHFARSMTAHYRDRSNMLKTKVVSLSPGNVKETDLFKEGELLKEKRKLIDNKDGESLWSIGKLLEDRPMERPRYFFDDIGIKDIFQYYHQDHQYPYAQLSTGEIVRSIASANNRDMRIVTDLQITPYFEITNNLYSPDKSETIAIGGHQVTSREAPYSFQFEPSPPFIFHSNQTYRISFPAPHWEEGISPVYLNLDYHTQPENAWYIPSKNMNDGSRVELHFVKKDDNMFELTWYRLAREYKGNPDDLIK